MANIKLLQLYRNSTIADSLEAAKTLMAEKAQGKDGEILICRYKDGETPTTLVGVNNIMDGDNNFLTYIESVSMTDVESTVTSAITTALGNLSGGGTKGDDQQFVTEVTETEGVITVTYGTITSTDGTVVINNGSGETAGNIDLGVNIDESTIVIDSKGKLSVSASAGGGYAGKEAISVNDKEISLTIAKDEQILSQSSDNGLKTTLTINYDSKTRYIQLLGNTVGEETNVISSFDATEFIVDGMIKSAELVDENPDTGATGEFIAITFNTEGGETTTIYIDVSELVDTYTAGDGLTLSDHEFSVKVKDEETYLEVTSDGIATKGIDDAIATAVAEETSRAQGVEAELQASIEAAVAGESTTVVAQGESNTHVTVSSSKEEGSTTTTYTINESDIASAATQSNIISAVGLSSEDGTLTDDQKTAIGGDDLVTAVSNLLAEVEADEVSLTVVSGDKSITVTKNADGKTDISVALSTVENSEYATDMIVKDTDGGLALNPVWDMGEY